MLSYRFLLYKAIQFLMQYPEFQHHYNMYMHQQHQYQQLQQQQLQLQQQQHHHSHQPATVASYVDNYINDISPSSQPFVADQTAKPSYYYQQEHQHYHPYYYQHHQSGVGGHWQINGGGSVSSTSTSTTLPPASSNMLFHTDHGNGFYSTQKPPQLAPFSHITQISSGIVADDQLQQQQQQQLQQQQQQPQQQQSQLLHYMPSGYRGKLQSLFMHKAAPLPVTRFVHVPTITLVIRIRNRLEHLQFGRRAYADFILPYVREKR